MEDNKDNKLEEFDEFNKKFKELSDNNLKSIKITFYLYGWAMLWWLNFGTGFWAIDTAFDQTNPSSVIMYGALGAASAGACTFETSKIIKNLKQRKKYLERFNELYDEIMNDKNKKITR